MSPPSGAGTIDSCMASSHSFADAARAFSVVCVCVLAMPWACSASLVLCGERALVSARFAQRKNKLRGSRPREHSSAAVTRVSTQGANTLHGDIEGMEAILHNLDAAFAAPSVTDLMAMQEESALPHAVAIDWGEDTHVQTPGPPAGESVATFQRRASSAGRKPGSELLWPAGSAAAAVAAALADGPHLIRGSMPSLVKAEAENRQPNTQPDSGRYPREPKAVDEEAREAQALTHNDATQGEGATEALQQRDVLASTAPTDLVSAVGVDGTLRSTGLSDKDARLLADYMRDKHELSSALTRSCLHTHSLFILGLSMYVYIVV